MDRGGPCNGPPDLSGLFVEEVKPVPMQVPVRRHTIWITSLLVAAVLVPAAGSATRVLPTLYVDYTMNCTFTITDDAGKRISSIPPGTYQIQIQTPVASEPSTCRESTT